MDKKDNFISAFTIGGSSIYEECECGKKYYEDTKSVDNLKDLKVDSNAFESSGVERISLNSKDYVLECDCWNEKMESVMNFLDFNAVSIAEYLNSERERKVKEANEIKPIVLDKN